MMETLLAVFRLRCSHFIYSPQIKKSQTQNILQCEILNWVSTVQRITKKGRFSKF